MKRLLMSSLAASMALSLITAPLALAQQDPHGSAEHSASHAPAAQHTQPHVAEQHQPMQGGMQHGTEQHTASLQHSETQHTVSHGPLDTSQGTHGAPQQHSEMKGGGGHAWHSGDHYTGSRRYVSNWSQYHLHQPPQGYEWVQDGSQFVLIAVATGVITVVILSSTYQ
jgi:Ni/Co efflux regulator RcnB